MTPAERKALAFLAGLAALGTGARAAGLGAPPEPLAPGDAVADERLALDRQLAAVDSARASRRPKGKRPRRRSARAAADTLATPAPPVDARAAPPAPAAPPPAGPPAAVDADQADSAALEALPGVGPALARRIVADRRAHGAFGSMAGLSRVPGIGPGLERRLAGRVTFSGRP